MMPQNDEINLCPGEQLSIVCSTNKTHEILQWAIKVPPDYNSSSPWIYLSSHVGNYPWGHIGDTILDYTKNSEPGVLPVISTLLINSATTRIDGAIVICHEHVRDSTNKLHREDIKITVIHVINGKLEQGDAYSK